VSTILKALQRLEDEKNSNVERSLDEQIVARRPPSDSNRRGLRLVAVAIGGFAAVAAAFFFWTARESPDAEVTKESRPPEAAPVAAQEVAAEKPRRRPSARTPPAAPAQQPSSAAKIASVVEIIEHLDAQPVDADAPAAAPKRAAPAARAGAERPARRTSAREPDSQVARAAERPRPARKEIANAEPPVTQILENSVPAKTAPAPPAPVEIAAVAPKSVPTAAPASLPAPIQEPEKKVVQRAKLPTLSVEKTIWHPDADRRVAIVKLIDAEEILRLKEGDAVGPLVIEVIKPGSVLFNHDGIEIRYNVGD